MIANKMNYPAMQGNDRVLPHNVNAESAVLSAIMAQSLSERRVREAVDKLTADMFYLPSNQNVFRTMAETRITDPVSLVSEMERMNRMGDLEFADVMNIARSHFTLSGLEQYVDIIRQSHAQRTLINLCHNTISQAFAGESAEESIFQLVDQMQRIEAGTEYNPPMIGDLTGLWYDLMQRRNQKDEKALGVETGIEGIDSTIVGMDVNWLLILAGRPSHGKSLFAQMIANHVSQSGPVLEISLEMGKMQIVDRVIGMLAGIDPADVKRASMSDLEWNRVSQELGDLKNGKRQIYLDDSPSLSLEQLCSRVKAFKRRRPNLKLVQVDYLGLIDTPQADRHDLSVGKITRRMKQLSKEVDVPIMLLTQLSREADKAKRPNMGMLADSASIERDADFVMFTHSLGVANPDTPYLRNTWMLICGKNRDGDMPPDVYIKKDKGFMRQMDDGEISQLHDMMSSAKTRKGGFDL